MFERSEFKCIQIIISEPQPLVGGIDSIILKGVDNMCGLHWYRQEIEKADGDNKRLDELKQMMEQRFKISENSLTKTDSKDSEIISIYKEIIERKI